MLSRARNLANLLGGGEVVVPATKIADIPASKLSDEISTIEQVSNTDLLTNLGNTVGDQRVVGNTLYIWNGSGWYRIALINETPTWDSGGQPLSSYTLSTDDPQVATTVTLSATDPDGLPIQYSHITGGQMDSIATITQDSSVFTITPKTEAQAPDGGTGTVTFRASDGVNILPYQSTFDLSWSAPAINSVSGQGYTTFTGYTNSNTVWYTNSTVEGNAENWMELSVTPGGQFYVGLIGASGGSGREGEGGRGGYGNALITVPPGVNTVTVYIGGGGKYGTVNNVAGGQLYGGQNATSQGSIYRAGSTGGGLVAVVTGSKQTEGNVVHGDVLFAVGSGGGGGNNNGNYYGGHGGKPGGNGTDGVGLTGDNEGRGATTSAGGAGGLSQGAYSSAGLAGSAFYGGRGGNSSYDGGCGGGAGYYGGGGGSGGGGYSGAPGGGGSGYINSTYAVVNNSTYEANGSDWTHITNTNRATYLLSRWANLVNTGSIGGTNTWTVDTEHGAYNDGYQQDGHKGFACVFNPPS